MPKTAGLGAKGRSWWKWAWRTPQAAAWSPGDYRALLRRAQLEDDVEALDQAPVVDVADLLDVEPTERSKELNWLIGRLAGMASGRLQVMREMRELDDRFGLTPKARAQLRWEVVEDEPVAGTGADDEMAKRRAEREARLAALQ